MRLSPSFLLLACAATGATATAQEFNLDLGSPSSSFGVRSAALGLPANQFTILFVGSTATYTPLADKRLCVKGALVRLGTKKATAGGRGLLGPGLQPTCGWIAGDTRYFQAWSRDPNGPCGKGSNLTNGYAIVFTP